jgi:hypothetical protein
LLAIAADRLPHARRVCDCLRGERPYAGRHQSERPRPFASGLADGWATAENWIYAFDANEPRGSENAVAWSNRFGFPVPSLSFGDGAGDIYRSTVGILGTPVIEITETPNGTKGGTIFAVAWVWKPEEFDDNPEKAYGHYLIAVDLVTGEPRGRKPRIKIEGDVEGGGYAAAGIYAVTGGVEQNESHSMVEARFAKNLAAIEVVNRNDDRKWRVTDTIRKNDKDYVRFNSAMQLPRPGLLLLNGTIYSAFGARGSGSIPRLGFCPRR